MVGTIQAKDGGGNTVQFAVQDEGAAGLVPVHIEDTAQRAALIAAIQAASTAVQPVTIASVPLPSGAATAAGINALAAQLPASLGSKPAAQSLPVTLASDGVYFNLQTAAQASLSAIQASVGGTLKADTVVQATSANRGAVVGTTAVNLMSANPVRRGFSIQNQSASANVYLSGVATATADFNCLMIAPGGYYETPPHHAGTGAVSVIASAASTSVYAREW